MVGDGVRKIMSIWVCLFVCCSRGVTISDTFLEAYSDVTTNRLIGSKGKRLGDDGALDPRNRSASGEKELEFGCNLKLNQLDP